MVEKKKVIKRSSPKNYRIFFVVNNNIMVSKFYSLQDIDKMTSNFETKDEFLNYLKNKFKTDFSNTKIDVKIAYYKDTSKDEYYEIQGIMLKRDLAYLKDSNKSDICSDSIKEIMKNALPSLERKVNNSTFKCSNNEEERNRILFFSNLISYCYYKYKTEDSKKKDPKKLTKREKEYIPLINTVANSFVYSNPSSYQEELSKLLKGFNSYKDIRELYFLLTQKQEKKNNNKYYERKTEDDTFVHLRREQKQEKMLEDVYEYLESDEYLNVLLEDGEKEKIIDIYGKKTFEEISRKR